MADVSRRIGQLLFFTLMGWSVLVKGALADPADRLDTELELAPGTTDSSPVLQEWSQETPDVLSTIRNDPSFPARLRLGYGLFPSSRDERGLAIGIEDVFVGDLPLTVNADYVANFDGNDNDRNAYGAHLRYYVLPLGGYVNVAPLVGYRHVEAVDYSESGVQVGFQVKVIPSRGGGADFAYTQSWVSPTEDDAVMITELEFGYGLTDRLRLATDVEWQFAPGATDSRLGIGVEWML